MEESPATALAYLRSVIQETVALQRFVTHEYSFDDESTYQPQLQSLEDEVRSHIKAELQMKLHIELLNEAIETTQAQYRTQKSLYRSQIQKLEEERQKLDTSSLKSDFERFLKLSKSNQRLESELSKHKQELKDTKLEIIALKRQNSQFTKLLAKREALAAEVSTAQFFKQKYEELTQKCDKAKALLKSKCFT